MIRREYTDEEKQKFHYFRFHHPNPRVRERFEVLWLHAHNKSFPEIAILANVSEASARKYFRLYQKGGIPLVETIGSHCPKSALDEHREKITQEFRARPPANSKEAAARIKALTGVDLKPRAVENYMKKIGMDYRKVGAIPGKADLEAQEEFKTNVLDIEIAKAPSGESVLLFVDAVHFVQAAFLGFLWCFERVFVKSPSGRKRWNVLGAYNCVTGELTSVANDSYITATQVCELLRKLALQYAGRPISIVLDNARYQRCKVVDELAKELGINLIFLPSYSPNLNLIERLWKFVKKKCLYNVYYETFEEFKAGINQCLDQVDKDYKSELATLMNPQFQNFKNYKIMSA